jgi:hypothetical protein
MNDNEEIDDFCLKFTEWKDKMFVRSKFGEYFPTGAGLSFFEIEPHTLKKILKIYREEYYENE